MGSVPNLLAPKGKCRHKSNTKYEIIDSLCRCNSMIVIKGVDYM